MVDQVRRNFFRGALKQVFTVAAAFEEGVAEAKARQEKESFFDSYESSSALCLAYPDDVLLESARRAGIEVEGREKIDIVKELFTKEGRL